MLGLLGPTNFGASKQLRPGDNDVVGGVGFAVGAEGPEGVMVGLAFVLIRTVPRIDTNHASEIARAEMIDEN